MSEDLSVIITAGIFIVAMAISARRIELDDRIPAPKIISAPVAFFMTLPNESTAARLVVMLLLRIVDM
jgi:hypothetical protein